jgi:tyrosinase
VPGECAEYSKPRRYSTVRYPLSGLVADLAATTEQNAMYRDDNKDIADLNEIVVKWLTAQPYAPSTSPPTSAQGLDYDRFRQSLLTPTYTLFSNNASRTAWNAAHQNGPLVFVLENPHNNMHVAIGGIDIPNYSRSLIPGASDNRVSPQPPRATRRRAHRPSLPP